MDALKRKKPPAEDLEEEAEAPPEDHPEEERFDDEDVEGSENGAANQPESIVDKLKIRLKEMFEKLKKSIDNIRRKLKQEPSDEEEAGYDDLLHGEEEDAGLTTVDPHFQQAFQQMQEEEEQALRDKEEAARKAREAEAATAAQQQSNADPALVEQLFMVLDKWEQIWVQQFQNTNAQLQTLEEKLDRLAEQIEEGAQAFPSLPPLPTAPIPIEGQRDSDLPPFPTRPGVSASGSPVIMPAGTGSDLIHARPSTATKAQQSPAQSAAMAMMELEELVKHPLSNLLSLPELDNVVALVLEPTGIDIWKVEEVRRSKTPYRSHHQSEEQVRSLLRNLDARLKKVEGFEEEKHRLGYILEAFSDPVYRNLINQKAFLKGDGTMIPPTKAQYDKVASAVGLRQWVESLERGQTSEVTGQLIPENSELFTQRYYLLPPAARKKLHSALIDEYVAQRRERLTSDENEEGQERPMDLDETLPEGVELIDAAALEPAL